MTDFSDTKVTIAVTPMGMEPLKRPIHRQRIMDCHGEPADEVTILVPEGTGAEVRDLIWKALGTAPRQTDAQFELMQAMGYEGNIGRMFEGTG